MVNAQPKSLETHSHFLSIQGNLSDKYIALHNFQVSSEILLSFFCTQSKNHTPPGQQTEFLQRQVAQEKTNDLFYRLDLTTVFKR